MFNYFYDSLETLKQLKKPTKQEVGKMVLQIFVIVVITGIIFGITDSLFASLYQFFYNLMS